MATRTEARATPHRMRMAELSTRSGVPRETIHFYLREGLLPRPVKAGRTVAFYGPEHLERLRTIRRLRDEKYLPLAVIRRLLDSPAAAERDLDALADVLHIAPDLATERGGPPPSPAAVQAAVERGLLGPRSAASRVAALPPEDAGAPERRVLAIVDEVLGLDPAARALTLDDLEASAERLAGLVEREAALFFDTVIRTADAGGAIAALRRGRGAVARFITAYRDLMLRRVVEELLISIERGPDRIARAATVPLSGEAERRLGVPARRATLWRQGEEARVWHLFSCGAAQELARLPAEAVAAAGPRAAALAAWGMHEVERRAGSLRGLAAAAAAAPGFALGEILLGEATIAQVLGRQKEGVSLLEAAVPALHRVAAADPGGDAEPAARAFGWFHRGRLELALPAVLGRAERGAAALREALAIVEDPAEAAAIEPAACARIRGNAALALGRYRAARGDREGARALLELAASVDPEGPLGKLARAELAPPAERPAPPPGGPPAPRQS